MVGLVEDPPSALMGCRVGDADLLEMSYPFAGSWSMLSRCWSGLNYKVTNIN